MAGDVSRASEHRLRQVFGAIAADWLASAELAVRLRASAPWPISRQAIYMAISSGHRCGLLLRNGAFPRFRYAINPAWQRAAVRPKRAHAGCTAPRPTSHALAYVGPAFDRAALAPALGLRPADPEVMPPEVAGIVDSLHRRFYQHAHGGEA